MPSVEESLCRGLFTVPYTVFTRWQASRISGIQPYSVIVTHRFLSFVSEGNLHNLHFHHFIADFGKETEKAADGRVTKVIVAQHIAAARDLQAVVPQGKLIFRVRNGEICTHILDFRTLEPCLCNHLHRYRVRRIKYQHTAGKASAIACTSALTCSVKK